MDRRPPGCGPECRDGGRRHQRRPRAGGGAGRHRAGRGRFGSRGRGGGHPDPRRAAVDAPGARPAVAGDYGGDPSEYPDFRLRAQCLGHRGGGLRLARAGSGGHPASGRIRPRPAQRDEATLVRGLAQGTPGNLARLAARGVPAVRRRHRPGAVPGILPPEPPAAGDGGGPARDPLLWHLWLAGHRPGRGGDREALRRRGRRAGPRPLARLAVADRGGDAAVPRPGRERGHRVPGRIRRAGPRRGRRLGEFPQSRGRDDGHCRRRIPDSHGRRPAGRDHRRRAVPTALGLGNAHPPDIRGDRPAGCDPVGGRVEPPVGRGATAARFRADLRPRGDRTPGRLGVTTPTRRIRADGPGRVRGLPRRPPAGPGRRRVPRPLPGEQRPRAADHRGGDRRRAAGPARRVPGRRDSASRGGPGRRGDPAGARAVRRLPAEDRGAGGLRRDPGFPALPRSDPGHPGRSIEGHPGARSGPPAAHPPRRPRTVYLDPPSRIQS